MRERAEEDEGTWRAATLLGRRWTIPEGYIPGTSTGPAPAMTSHESICILSATAEHAHIAIHLYFGDLDPAGPYRVSVPVRRTKHLRFNDLTDLALVPRDTDHASVIESDVPSSCSTPASTHARPRTPSSLRLRTLKTEHVSCWLGQRLRVRATESSPRWS